MSHHHRPHKHNGHHHHHHHKHGGGGCHHGKMPLDKAVQALGDFVERQVNHLTDPSRSVNERARRMAFDLKAHGEPLIHGISKRLGLKYEGYIGGLERIVEVTKARGSEAAAKIEKYMPQLKELVAKFEETHKKAVETAREQHAEFFKKHPNHPISAHDNDPHHNHAKPEAKKTCKKTCKCPKNGR